MKIRASRGYQCPASMFGKTPFNTKKEFYDQYLDNNANAKAVWEAISPGLHDKYLKKLKLYNIDYASAPKGAKPQRTAKKYWVVEKKDEPTFVWTVK